MTRPLLLLALSCYIGLQAGVLAVNNTLLGIPFLFPYHLRDNCSQLYPANDANQFRFIYTSQIQDQGSLVEFFTVHIFHKTDGACKRHPQVFSKFLLEGYTVDGTFQSDDEFCNNTFSLCYQCKNQVMAVITYFHSNPSVSMITHLFGDSFNNSLAIYPMDVFEDFGNETYTYRVIFGAPTPGKMDGIVLHTMFYETNITLLTSVDVGVLRNGQKYQFYREGETIEFTDECHNTIFWIEAHTNPSDARKLQQTVIESNKPMKVFTNQAYVNKSGGFSFETQLVHEMPPLDKWGEHFTIDVQQAKMLPVSMRSALKYDLSITSSEESAVINVTYHYWENDRTSVEQFNLYGSDPVTIHKDHNFVHTLTFITVEANSPILIVYSIHNSNPRHKVYYSVIAQPTSWFSNIQTITLSTANSSDLVNYVSVVVPNENYDPEDIMLSMAQSINQSSPISKYDGFSKEKVVSTSGEYTLFSFSVNQDDLSEMDNDTMLIWHNNRSVRIGVTVFAYSPQKQYAYSNGYVLEHLQSETPQLQTPASSTDSKVIVIIILAVLLAVVSLSLFVVCYCRRKDTRSTYHHVRDDEQPIVSEEPGTDFEYDLFILFSDEDESLVQNCIYGALKEEGYKVLWRYDPTHGLFQPGADIVTDLAKAIQISRKILVICTKNFCERQAFERDVSFFKDVQMSERKRRLIPFVLEQEYPMADSNQFKEYNQIRVKQRQDLLRSTVARDVLQKLINSLGEPLSPTTMENLL